MYAGARQAARQDAVQQAPCASSSLCLAELQLKAEGCHQNGSVLHC